MRRITDPAILRAFKHFDLGSPNHSPVCHGWRCGCSCKACRSLDRQAAERGFGPDGKLNPPPKPAQPWDPSKKRAA